MASAGNINGKITVELSATDRALLARIAKALEPVQMDASLATGGYVPPTRRLAEPENGSFYTKAEVQEIGGDILRRMNESNPPAEGDHLLDPDADHTGDDVE